MNIFVLSKNPKHAAKYSCDKHVVKMILESAQLLYSAHHMSGTKEFGNVKPYKLTHKNHPCSIWVRESKQNYLWLLEHFEGLLNEYWERFGAKKNKMHKTSEHLEFLTNVPNIPDIGLTKFVMAMPEHCIINDNPVASYRNYYIVEKSHMAKWINENIPYWWHYED